MQPELPREDNLKRSQLKSLVTCEYGGLVQFVCERKRRFPWSKVFEMWERPDLSEGKFTAVDNTREVVMGSNRCSVPRSNETSAVVSCRSLSRCSGELSSNTREAGVKLVSLAKGRALNSRWRQCRETAPLAPRHFQHRNRNPMATKRKTENVLRRGFCAWHTFAWLG